MARPREEVLRQQGLSEAALAHLTAALRTLDRRALSGSAGTTDAHVLLDAAVAAARDAPLMAEALPVLLRGLEEAEASLGEVDAAVLWHLRGLRAWRLDHDVPASTRALNRCIVQLEGVVDPAAAAYLPRALDTLGQVLQHQGLLTDARREFERALALRRAGGDAEGAALTEGNLGRLCLDLGDFHAAAGHLRRDLDYVERETPALTRLRSQLMTHIGACLTELDEPADALRFLEGSYALATSSGDPVGVAFAQLYLGRLAVRGNDGVRASRHAEAAQRLLPSLPPHVAQGLEGLTLQLEAEVVEARGDRSLALELYADARTHFDAAPRVTPVEHAEFLDRYAQACEAQGRTQEAASLLREALRRLDATTAEDLRANLDARLRAVNESAWMLHSAGRFVGHSHIDFLLSQAGQAGFRGHEEHVTVLFSDLRNFTSVSEGLAPEVLIEVLNRYLGAMTRCIEHFGGMVDKFIGDAVMAVFSLPTPRADDVDRAVAAALFMEAELDRFNRTLPEGVAPLAAGVGLHTGRVVAGLIGSPRKRSYTVIGDAVNTASRLEGMTKHLGAPTIISGETKDGLLEPDRWLLLALGRFRPKGRRGAIDVFQLRGERDGSARARAVDREIAAAAEALVRFQAGGFAEARARYDALAQASDEGGQSSVYAQLAAYAAAYGAAPPVGSWDGTIGLTEK